MSNHQKRILAGCGLGIMVLTAAYLPLAKSPIVHWAYLFLLLNVVLFGGALWQLSRRSQNGYLTGVAFPLGLWSVLLVSAGVSVGAVALQLSGLWNVPWQWLVVVQLAVLAFAGWRMLAIGAGEEVIQKTDDLVMARTAGWKTLRADSEALLLSAPPKAKADFQLVRDAIRYADPSSLPEVSAIEEEIRSLLKQMKELAVSGEDTSSIARRIEQLVSERGTRLKLMK